MATNITFDGFVYDKDTALGDSTIYYQAYFYINGTASSPSKFNTVRQCEASAYYSCNLGDSDFLGQESTVLVNSKVVLVFWKGGSDRIADCGILTEWGATEFQIDGSSFYTNDVQILDNIAPDLHWSTNIPAHPYVDTTYTIYNTSEDEHSWDFGGVTMYHWYTRYGQTINGPNFIDYTDYYWGDNSTSLNQNGTTDGTHSYDAAGAYDVVIEVFDSCKSSVSGSLSFNIYWHAPVPNITMEPANPLPNEPVSFEYTGTDIDDRITSIEWIVDDTGSYGTTNTSITVNRDDIVYHTEGTGTDWYNQVKVSGAFSNPGSHSVSIVINWNDGFDDQTINYSENFTQGKFSGPTVRFIQEPVPAPVGSGISFINTSINTSRVGLGLPNHMEYSWTWTDATGVASITDTPFSYEFEKTPTSAAAQVSLCAEWSDGWDTKTTCISEDVVFETTVTVTPEDCYYSINVVGTSSDGTVNNYGWTVSSGITEEGPWNLVWESPIGIDQQQKTLCFSTTGWYKVTGFVYGTGNTTSDYDTLLITETCPDSASIYNIWNGTGILDVEADWLRSGVGEESTASKYRGTNGLDVSYDKDNESIYFYRNNALDMDSNDYDFLSFWINVKSWNSKKDVVISLYSTNYSYGVDVNLSSYIDIASLGPWTKVMIPLSNFKLTPQTDKEGWPTYINKLRFKMEGDISFWLDNVALTMGSLVTVPICNPDPDVYNIGEMGMTAELITPAPMKSEDLSLIPGPKASKKDIGTITPKVKVYSPFPKPINL